MGRSEGEGGRIRGEMEGTGCWEEVERLALHCNGEIARLAERIVNWTWEVEMEEEGFADPQELTDTT